MRICLDFDGVLHDAAHPLADRKMGPPIPGALIAVLALADVHELVVHSARAHDEARAQHVYDWLRWYKFPYMEVSVAKPMADVYVDDKGVRFSDWDHTLFAIASLDTNGQLRPL